MDGEFLVLIGDIIKSKNIENRKEVQGKLSTIFNKLNKEMDGIVSPFTITLGDEFQVVFDTAKKISQSLLTISETIFPYEIRYSLAIGDITTNINKKTSIGMDGPAFYEARNGIENLKTDKKYFSLYTKSGKYDLLITAGMEIIFSEIYRYKSTNRANLFVKTLKGMRQDQAAQEQGVSRQNISKNIKRWQIEQKIVQMKEFEKLMEENL